MKQLILGAPIVAVIVTATLILSGAAWWVAISAFFLAAPLMIGLATVSCNTVLSCHDADRTRAETESASS